MEEKNEWMNEIKKKKMKNKGVLHTVGTLFLRNNAITWQGGGGGVGGLGVGGWGG